MKAPLALLLQRSVRQGLAEAGYEIVKVGEVPWWFERVYSMPAEVYRMKQIEED